MMTSSYMLSDKPTCRCKTSHILHLCRQNKTLLLWYPKGLPSDCTLYKSSSQAEKWEWDWGGAYCWVAANCKFTLVFPVSFTLMVVTKVEEDAAETGKKGFVNFKRVVWHDSFHQLLDSIHARSKDGFHIQCGDGIVRHLFPVILILSADYEEQ